MVSFLIIISISDNARIIIDFYIRNLGIDYSEIIKNINLLIISLLLIFCINNFLFITNKLVINREWNIIDDGSYLDKALYLYCKSKPNAKGLAIGTHDGEFGEWVIPTIQGLTKATLVEASTPQFEKLNTNYKKYSNVTLIHNLITTKGQTIEFFEGGKGYTNSVKQEVINSWEKEPISSSMRSSIAINDLLSHKIDWLHTDIEGYDAELLQAIDPNFLPPFIIFEHNNLKIEDKLELENYLIDLGYFLNRQDPVSYLAIKK